MCVSNAGCKKTGEKQYLQLLFSEKDKRNLFHTLTPDMYEVSPAKSTSLKIAHACTPVMHDTLYSIEERRGMKPGRGIACEEHLLGPAVPRFDRFAGGMRI